MNICSTFYALKRYGLKGILDYILDLPREWNFKRRIFATSNPAVLPQPGITLITCFDYPGSLSKVMRDFAIMLKQANIPYQTFNIPCQNPIPPDELKSFLTRETDFVINKFSHIITMRTPLLPPEKRCNVYCSEFWEFEDGFIENCPEALNAQNILAFSQFNCDTFKRLLPPSIAVKKVLYPFQFFHDDLAPIKTTRLKYGIAPNDFVVFFNFDFASSYFRKNPEGILKAFAKAFTDKSDVKVVFKTMRAKKCANMNERLLRVVKDLKLSNKFISIDDFIPQKELVDLTNACDVYMSLHRGEGFGLGIAEAMSLGKAVIVTDYSSTSEFCNSINSIPIPYKIVPVPPDQIDNKAYQHVSMWAEPDIDAAADALINLYNNKTLKDELGRKASIYIKEHFSIENFRKSINSFLNNE